MRRFEIGWVLFWCAAWLAPPAAGQTLVALVDSGLGSVRLGPGLAFLPPGSNPAERVLDSGRLAVETLPARPGIQQLKRRPLADSGAVVFFQGEAFPVPVLDVSGLIEFTLPPGARGTVVILYLAAPGEG